MSNFTHLTPSERTLLKSASELSQNVNKLAKEFREMLINRECITSLTTLSEFMAKDDLMEAIKLSWMLGYSDQNTKSNASKGIISDYELIQLPPQNNQSILTDDVETINKLTKLRNSMRKNMNRNVDTFIRNMGWINEDVEPKTKKRQTHTKEQVIDKVDKLIDSSCSASSSLTGSVARNIPMTKSKTDKGSMNSTHVPAYNSMKNSDEVIEATEIEAKKYLKKLLDDSNDGCAIIAYCSDDDIRMNIINANGINAINNVLDSFSDSAVVDNMNDMNINGA